jgi:hypothetical protein
MDLNATVAWIKGNPYATFLIGLATAHRRLIFRYGILAVLKTSVGRRVALGDADDVLADIDDFRAELVQDIAEAKEADAAKAAASAQVHAETSAPAPEKAS